MTDNKISLGGVDLDVPADVRWQFKDPEDNRPCMHRCETLSNAIKFALAGWAKNEWADVWITRDGAADLSLEDIKKLST